MWTASIIMQASAVCIHDNCHKIYYKIIYVQKKINFHIFSVWLVIPWKNI
jgi:hypothetical protein